MVRFISLVPDIRPNSIRVPSYSEHIQLNPFGYPVQRLLLVHNQTDFRLRCCCWTFKKSKAVNNFIWPWTDTFKYSLCPSKGWKSQFSSLKDNFHSSTTTIFFQILFSDKKPDILSRHLRALNEEGDNSLDYDSKENISTTETEIISHSRILALQLPEITKDLSYGGKF